MYYMYYKNTFIMLRRESKENYMWALDMFIPLTV